MTKKSVKSIGKRLSTVRAQLNKQNQDQTPAAAKATHETEPLSAVRTPENATAPTWPGRLRPYDRVLKQ